MTRFYRRLIAAREQGYGAELAFWADYAERHNYQGAARLRAMAEAYLRTVIPAELPAGRREPGPMPASQESLVERRAELSRLGSPGSHGPRIKSEDGRPENDKVLVGVGHA